MDNPVITKEHFLQANCQFMKDVRADIEKDIATKKEKAKKCDYDYNHSQGNARHHNANRFIIAQNQYIIALLEKQAGEAE